NPWYK
ncbi:hypothetical protein CPC698_0363B, partial [Chlamydia psittaci C6/98]